MNNSNNINFDLNTMGSSDIQSMYNVINAFEALNTFEDIMEGGTGFNLNSGYVYIALENGITIASCFGQSVDYIVTNFDNGEEEFLDTYEEAQEALEALNA